jgi:hypothetical protein
MALASPNRSICERLRELPCANRASPISEFRHDAIIQSSRKKPQRALGNIREGPIFHGDRKRILPGERSIIWFAAGSPVAENHLRV